MCFVKAKKQKKSKAESKETAEIRMSMVGGSEPAPLSDQSLATTEGDGEWNVVGMPKVRQTSVVTPLMWVASWYECKFGEWELCGNKSMDKSMAFR